MKNVVALFTVTLLASACGGELADPYERHVATMKAAAGGGSKAKEECQSNAKKEWYECMPDFFDCKGGMGENPDNEDEQDHYEWCLDTYYDQSCTTAFSKAWDGCKKL